MLVEVQKLYEWGQLTYSSFLFLFLEQAGIRAPFGPQVALSLSQTKPNK